MSQLYSIEIMQTANLSFWAFFGKRFIVSQLGTCTGWWPTSAAWLRRLKSSSRMVSRTCYDGSVQFHGLDCVREHLPPAKDLIPNPDHLRQSICLQKTTRLTLYHHLSKQCQSSGCMNADNLIKISKLRQANTKQWITRKDMQHAAMPERGSSWSSHKKSTGSVL